MALSFPCNHCSESIIVRYLKIGEVAECAKCGRRTTIPVDANSVDASDYIRPPSSTIPSERVEAVGSSPISIIAEIFRVLGIIANLFQFILFGIGLIQANLHDVEWVIRVLAFLTSAITIYALVGRIKRYIKVAFVANILVSILLGILISVYGRYYSFITGMFMIMQGLVSILSLTIIYKWSSSKS